MIKPLLSAVALLSLSACMETSSGSELQPGTPVQLSSAQVQQVRAGVRDVLKDPDSAQFGTIKAARKPDGVTTVCGYVNGKNSYGGYTGMTPFVGVMLSGGGFSVAALGGPGYESQATINVCRKSGIAI